MSSGMPELGSKISLISKADIRYEGRLFTVDPQECTIALASVRSFGTEDRETQYPVAPQSQVYDYILFRGSDIKDIRVLNNVPSLPNDPAIMQMSVPPTLGGAAAPGQFAAQFSHPVVGQSQYPQYHPMAGFPGGVHTQLNKTSELSPQTSVDMGPQPPAQGPIGSGMAHHANQVKDQGSMLDLIGGGSQQSASRSGTPAVGHRKSPTADQGTQVSVAGGSGQQRDGRRGSTGAGAGGQKPRNRTNSRNRQRYPSGGAAQPAHHPNQHQGQHQQHQGQQHQGQHQQHQGQHQQHHQGQQNHQQQHYQGQQHHLGGPGGYRGGGGGGWRGRGRGGPRGGSGRGFVPRNKNTLKFDNDYDFEQANTEFEELRSQLAKAKIADGDTKVETETEKKDDSGNETGAGEAEQEDDYTGYDKKKSFFDNISCEAVERVNNKDGASGAGASASETDYTGYDKKKSFFDNISCDAAERSKGRSQRTDWRTERKLNSETFGVALARRGAWRGRGGWRHNPHHPQQGNNYNTFYANNYSWRPMRGGRGRGGGGGGGQFAAPHSSGPRAPRPSNSAPAASASSAPAPAPAGAAAGSAAAPQTQSQPATEAAK